ncbi:hypothetical protein ACJZ2D_011511 [Fusarium nematophilum]
MKLSKVALAFVGLALSADARPSEPKKHHKYKKPECTNFTQNPSFEDNLTGASWVLDGTGVSISNQADLARTGTNSAYIDRLLLPLHKLKGVVVHVNSQFSIPDTIQRPSVTQNLSGVEAGKAFQVTWFYRVSMGHPVLDDECLSIPAMLKDPS